MGSAADCPGPATAPHAVGLPIAKPGPPQEESDRSDLVGLKSIGEVGGAAAIRQRGIPFHRVTHPLATDHYKPASLTQPAARALKIGSAASRVCRRTLDLTEALARHSLIQLDSHGRRLRRARHRPLGGQAVGPGGDQEMLPTAASMGLLPLTSAVSGNVCPVDDAP